MPHQCTNCGRTFADGSKEMLSGCPDCGGNKFQFRPASATDSTSTGTTANSSSTTSPSPDPDSPSAGSTDPNSESTGPTPPESSSVDPSETSPSSADSSEVGPSSADSPDVSVRPSEETDAERDTVSADRDSGSWPDPAAESDQDEADEGGLTDAAARAGAAVRDRLSSSTEGADTPAEEEDSAQATARSDVVSREELSAAARDVESDAPDEAPESGDDRSRHPGQAPPEDTVADTPSEGEQPDLSELREELNDQFESIKIVSPGQYELNLMELYDRDEYIISLQEDGRYVIEVPDRWREDE